MTPHQTYQSLMETVRGRLDIILELKASSADDFLKAESAAFHGRKVVEAIAFGCLVAVENGLKDIPKDAKGQWNAEKILRKLKSKGLSVLPNPSNIRQANPEEMAERKIKVVIEGAPENCLSHDDLIEIYQGLHSWLHEVNPYTHGDHSEFYAERSYKLWSALSKLEQLVERHFISIRGAAFFCVLRDKVDHKTKVIAFSKDLA